MKELFTIDDFMVAFIASLGYGFGETFAKLFGWPELACIAASCALGIALEEAISKIAFSEAVQGKKINRILTYTAFFLIFVIAHSISMKWLGVSMLEHLMENFMHVVALPILGFILNLFIHGYRVRKIRKLYGDGSKGYVFNVKNEDIAKANQQNQPIIGEYDADCAVRTRTGIYVGKKDTKTVCYLGIPYAKPPVGKLRWKAPEPLPSSEAVFEAKYYGASAIQVEHRNSLLNHHRQSEDCLTLNVVTGVKKTKELKPVLVLFHHGDFSYGGSVDPLLDGGKFVGVHSDVVFVSFNFRLGLFGFIDFTDVPGGEAYPDALNLGLLDQIAALQWIRENIAAFGGDPNRITALGFEAGATSICLLAASEKAKGLFQKAFLFDGSPVLAYDDSRYSRALAVNLLKETHTTTMDELSQLDTESLNEASQRLWQGANMYSPSCDGALIPADVYGACRDGAASGIDFIIGFPSKEMQVFRSFLGDKNYENLIFAGVDYVQKCTDSSVANALQEYIAEQTASSTKLEAASKFIEQWNALCIYRFALRLTNGGNKVHLMYWDEKPLIENLGSGTVDFANTLLGNSKVSHMYGSVMNADLSEVLQSFLMKFMNGNALRLYPNEIKGVSAFDWEAFPKALIVSDGKFLCDTIEDRLTEVKGLLDYLVKL